MGFFPLIRLNKSDKVCVLYGLNDFTWSLIDFPCTFWTLISKCCIDRKAVTVHFESHALRWQMYIVVGPVELRRERCNPVVYEQCRLTAVTCQSHIRQVLAYSASDF